MVDRERADDDAHVGRELAQHLEPEPRGQREDEAEDAEGRQPDHAVEQPHHDVVEALRGSPRAGAPARCAPPRGPTPRKSANTITREEVALGHRRDDVRRHEPHQRGRPRPRRRPPAGAAAAARSRSRERPGARPAPGCERCSRARRRGAPRSPTRRRCRASVRRPTRPRVRRSPSPATPSGSAETIERQHQHEEQPQEELARPAPSRARRGSRGTRASRQRVRRGAEASRRGGGRPACGARGRATRRRVYAFPRARLAAAGKMGTPPYPAKGPMDALAQLLDVFLHLDAHLTEWAGVLGPWLYVVLFLIVFCETGLVVTPFLPGDSLLFAAGALCALDGSPLSIGPLARAADRGGGERRRAQLRDRQLSSGPRSSPASTRGC